MFIKANSTHNSTDIINDPYIQVIAAEVRQRKRLDSSKMEQILLTLRTGRWLTRYELSVILGRNSQSLRERFLNPMIAKGMLQLRYPDKPNHVGQAYSATNVRQ